MAVDKILRFSDYDRRDADAVSPRNPADAAVIIIWPRRTLSEIETDNRIAALYDLPSVFLPENVYGNG